MIKKKKLPDIPPTRQKSKLPDVPPTRPNIKAVTKVNKKKKLPDVPPTKSVPNKEIKKGMSILL